MSPAQLRVLNTLGWRYSATPDAYVHRLAQGRIGPVFRTVDPLAHPDAVTDPILFEALVSRRRPKVVVDAHEREPLPRRATPEPRPRIAVEVQLADHEPPRVVHVDGRPPTRGADPSALRPAKKVVALRSTDAATA